MSIRPIDSQVAMTRNPELAADRARDIRQTGLTSGTLNEIVKDKEEDLRTVKDKFEIEMLRVRPDDKEKNSGGQEQEKKDKPAPGGGKHSAASERLLNLPVTSERNKVPETKRFDIRV